MLLLQLQCFFHAADVVTLSANLRVVRFSSSLLVLASLVSIAPSDSQSPRSSQNAQRARLFKHRSTVVWSCSSSEVQALVYEGGFAVDADGAYRAYHPDKRLGLDSIDHAGHRGNWWALATDTGKPNGRPVLQGKDDPAPGYYVSMTALYDSTIVDERNPRRFVDAASVPYVVLPPEGLTYARLGDFATVVNLDNGKVAGAIVADVSGRNLPMGEGSIALAKMLDIDPDPRTGGTDGGVAYLIYAKSGNHEPRSPDEIATAAETYFKKWGGLLNLHNCFP